MVCDAFAEIGCKHISVPESDVHRIVISRCCEVPAGSFY